MPGAGGLDALKAEALKQRRWRLGEDGYIEKGPFPKDKATVNVSLESTDPSTGKSRLNLTPRNAGDSPIVHYQPRPEVTETDPQVDDLDNFSTGEGSLYFWVRDPTGKYESGPPVAWVADLKIRHQVEPAADKRRITLESTPRADMTWSLDGSNPKDGARYDGPFEIGPEAVLLLVYASAGEANKKAEFRIPASKDGQVHIDDSKPARLQGARIVIDTTDKVYGVINRFRDSPNTLFKGVRIETGEGENTITIRFQGRKVTATIIEGVINSIRDIFQEDQTPVSMTISDGIEFETGHAAKEFARIAGIELKPGDLVQEA